MNNSTPANMAKAFGSRFPGDARHWATRLWVTSPRLELYGSCLERLANVKCPVTASGYRRRALLQASALPIGFKLRVDQA
jgi:hypothetical protein